MTDRILGPPHVGIDPDLPRAAIELAGTDPMAPWCLNLSHWIGFAAGCRELLRLVAPDIPQPDCAPGWMLSRRRRDGGMGTDAIAAAERLAGLVLSHTGLRFSGFHSGR